jgi:hypothetical protein
MRIGRLRAANAPVAQEGAARKRSARAGAGRAGGHAADADTLAAGRHAVEQFADQPVQVGMEMRAVDRADVDPFEEQAEEHRDMLGRVIAADLAAVLRATRAVRSPFSVA